MTDPMASLDALEEALWQLRTFAPDLPPDRGIESWCCGVCSRCKADFGMRSILEDGYDRERDKGYHYRVEWTPNARVFGGRYVEGRGRTGGEAWHALLEQLM